ncbi:MAG: hypothetical protein MK212_16075 [Saprospiraceae bacterium]|nr:hypothetical protein [Saprospiraceae bacterium]
MKNFSVIFLCLTVFTFVLSSCSSRKGCRGGGWYGNRNLGMLDKVIKQQVDHQKATIRLEEIVAMND